MENRNMNQTGMPQDPSAKLLQEAAEYFRSRPGFKRLINGLIEKYLSLGRIGGTIVLNEVSAEERSALEAFFRRRLPEGRLNISVSQFIEAFEATKFGGLELLDLLTVFHNGELLTKREERERDERAWQSLIQQFMAEFQDPNCRFWLQAILNKDPDTRLVHRMFFHNCNFAKDMSIALHALTNLPQGYLRLPVFNRGICGDPHGLDSDRDAGKMFIEGLKYIWDHQGQGKGEDNQAAFSATEAINELFYHFRLLRDDILNFASCFGFAAYANGLELSYWRNATESNAPLNPPLREIIRVTNFSPYIDTGRHQLVVFVVENSGIFSALLDDCFPLKPMLVCLHGQFKLASWALLDRLIQSGAVLNYSGDFDPEGLQMAEKLFKRYPDRIRFWRMTEEDYWQASPEVLLDEARLSKLKSISNPELRALASVIENTRRAAYQEGILQFLTEDLKCFFSKSE